MVLDLKFDDFDMLFTGDLEGEGETQLIESGSLRKYDILKVAHHGSKSSSIEEFLEKVKPKIALIGVGEKNTFGHPNVGVLKRLRKNNSKIYRTDLDGEITIITNGNTITIDRFIK